ncbi:MAG TPA: hypothetical protein VG253_03855 [Streptosporangiaceae bacterium]|nr:hypothetical protein [Streptosporangiaceae bacterium]
MIRRLFWLTLGAAIGISGYRRVTAVARAISPGHRARELSRFAGDVREGMEIYMERHPRPEPPTLEGQQARRALQGSAGPAQPPHRTNHAEDGH